jgi:hypothetical protein
MSRFRVGQELLAVSRKTIEVLLHARKDVFTIPVLVLNVLMFNENFSLNLDSVPVRIGLERESFPYWLARNPLRGSRSSRPILR